MKKEADTFGQILKARREALGLSQKVLGEAIGVSQSYIAQLESDTRGNPSLHTLQALAKALRTSLSIFDKARPPKGK